MFREKLLQCVESVECVRAALASVQQYIATERTVDEQNLLRLLQPLKKHFESHLSVNPALPSEAHILNQKFSSLEETLTTLLTSFMECISSRSKIYVNQIKRMREVSNTACRNALQGERAEFNGQIIHLKKQHMHALQEQSTSKMQALQEKDETIHILTTKLAELESQKVLFDDREVAMELLRSEMQQRVASAVATALKDANATFDNQRADVVDSYEAKLRKQEALADKREEEAEFNFNEKMAVQAAHHEQLYNILSEEKNRLHQDNLSLRTELQEQAKRFAQEKVEYIEECNAELRRSEQEADARVAEQIKAISAVKAEAAAKVRLAQEKERVYMDEVNCQRLKEKDEIEGKLNSEIDDINAQHRRALQQLRAQLDVKHTDELSRCKRNHENEVRRLVAETERLKKLVIRRGVGAGQDGIELEMEEPPLFSTDRSCRLGATHNDNKASMATSFAQYLEQHSPPPTNGTSRVSSSLPTMTYDRVTETRSPHSRRPQDNKAQGDKEDIRSHTPQTSRLQWGALRESLSQQDEVSAVVSPIPKDNDNNYESILESSPSGRLRFSQPIAREASNTVQHPPPPPPNTYLVDEAYEASREKGKGKSSVSNNATNIGKYMGQLQKYLEGDTGIEDTTFNSNSTGDSTSAGISDKNNRYSQNLYESSEDSDEVDSLNDGD